MEERSVIKAWIRNSLSLSYLTENSQIHLNQGESIGI